MAGFTGFPCVTEDRTSLSGNVFVFVRRYSDMPRAADVVNTLDQRALASILSAYGEERHARKIASAIVEARCVNPITRTQQLAAVVAGTQTAPPVVSAAFCEAKTKCHKMKMKQNHRNTMCLRNKRVFLFFPVSPLTQRIVK